VGLKNFAIGNGLGLEGFSFTPPLQRGIVA